MNYGTNYDNLCLKLKIWDLDRKIDFSKKQIVSVAFTNQQTHLIKNTVVIDVDPSEQEITVGYSLVTDYGISKQIIRSVKLIKTPCHYGGYRWWFICPGSPHKDEPCLKRVGVLYLPLNNFYFTCRFCTGLTYWSKTISYGQLHDSGMMDSMVLWAQIDKLELNVGRRQYAGKPTKKQAKLNELYRQLERR